MEITDLLLIKKTLLSPKKSVDRLNKSVSTPVVFFQRIDRSLQSVPRLKIGKHISAAKPVDRLFGITDHIEHMIPFCLSVIRSEEHTSELQSRGHLVCRLLLEN